jgi:hypothetical protein
MVTMVRKSPAHVVRRQDIGVALAGARAIACAV